MLHSAAAGFCNLIEFAWPNMTIEIEWWDSIGLRDGCMDGCMDARAWALISNLKRTRSTQWHFGCPMQPFRTITHFTRIIVQ